MLKDDQVKSTIERVERDAGLSVDVDGTDDPPSKVSRADEELDKTRTGSWRDFIGFFLLGALSDLSYGLYNSGSVSAHVAPIDPTTGSPDWSKFMSSFGLTIQTYSLVGFFTIPTIWALVQVDIRYTSLIGLEMLGLTGYWLFGWPYTMLALFVLGLGYSGIDATNLSLAVYKTAYVMNIFNFGRQTAPFLGAVLGQAWTISSDHSGLYNPKTVYVPIFLTIILVAVLTLLVYWFLVDRSAWSPYACCGSGSNDAANDTRSNSDEVETYSLTVDDDEDEESPLIGQSTAKSGGRLGRKSTSAKELFEAAGKLSFMDKARGLNEVKWYIALAIAVDFVHGPIADAGVQQFTKALVSQSASPPLDFTNYQTTLETVSTGSGFVVGFLALIPAITNTPKWLLWCFILINIALFAFQSAFIGGMTELVSVSAYYAMYIFFNASSNFVRFCNILQMRADESLTGILKESQFQMLLLLPQLFLFATALMSMFWTTPAYKTLCFANYNATMCNPA